jgi:tetratricopeptide (TPR) repeat protein
MKIVFARVGIAMTLLVVASGARAADDKDRARVLFQQAQQAFEQKNYAAAAAAFEEAAQLAPHPAAWLDAAEAWELDRELPRAAQDCDRALAMPDASETHRREAATRLARLLPSVATLEASDRAGSGLRVTMDGGPEEHVPTRFRLAPGRHVLAVLAPSGTPAGRFDLDLAAGETRTQELTPAAPPPAAGPPPLVAEAPLPVASAGEPGSRRMRSPPVASWIAFATSAAAVATAVVAGELTLSARTDFNQAPTFERRDHFYAMRTVTNVAWATAGGAAVVGVALWVRF